MKDLYIKNNIDFENYNSEIMLENVQAQILF